MALLSGTVAKRPSVLHVLGVGGKDNVSPDCSQAGLSRQNTVTAWFMHLFNRSYYLLYCYYCLAISCLFDIFRTLAQMKISKLVQISECRLVQLLLYDSGGTMEQYLGRKRLEPSR